MPPTSSRAFGGRKGKSKTAVVPVSTPPGAPSPAQALLSAHPSAVILTRLVRSYAAALSPRHLWGVLVACGIVSLMLVLVPFSIDGFIFVGTPSVVSGEGKSLGADPTPRPRPVFSATTSSSPMPRPTPEWLVGVPANSRTLVNRSLAWGPPGYFRNGPAPSLSQLLEPDSDIPTRAPASSGWAAAALPTLSPAKRRCLAAVQGHLDRNRVSLRQALHPLAALGIASAPAEDVMHAFGPLPPGIVACVRVVLNEARPGGAAAAGDSAVSLNVLLRLIDGGREPFLFVIPSHNNADNFRVNLGSVRAQTYPARMLRVIYIDDDSNDGTPDAAASYFEAQGMLRQASLLRTRHHAGPGYSRFLAYGRAWDDEVLAMLDGDDWLFNPGVLGAVEAHYRAHGLLASYGGYYVYQGSPSDGPKAMGKRYGGGRWLMCAKQYPPALRESRAYSHKPWYACHLRTARAAAFKAIEARHILGPDG